MTRELNKELARIYKAFGYSRDGFVAAWRDAGAFRSEVIATPFIIALAVYLADGTALAALLASWLLVIVTELVNTGIEAVTDLATKGEIHPLAKKAKDAGSAAVLASVIICMVVWCCVLL